MQYSSHFYVSAGSFLYDLLGYLTNQMTW